MSSIRREARLFVDFDFGAVQGVLVEIVFVLARQTQGRRGGEQIDVVLGIQGL
jgi:hypothetical protein